MWLCSLYYGRTWWSSIGRGPTYYGSTNYAAMRTLLWPYLVVEQGEASRGLVALPRVLRAGEAGKGGERSRGHLAR